MELQRLRVLRRKQIILLNGTYVLVLGIYTCLLSVFPPTISAMFQGIASLSLLGVILSIFRQRSSRWWFKLFPFMQEIHEYEQVKLNRQQTKLQKSIIVSNLLQAGLFFWLSLQAPTDQTLELSKLGPLLLGIIMVALLVVINLSLFRHIKRVDHDSAEQLRHYAWKTWIFAIIASVITVLVMFFLTIIIVTHS